MLSDEEIDKKLDEIIFSGELADYAYYLLDYFNTVYNISGETLDEELAKVRHGGSEIIEAGLTKEFRLLGFKKCSEILQEATAKKINIRETDSYKEALEEFKNKPQLGEDNGLRL